jgi:predicted ATP-grasp superfamily ATP-dependent carboligase
MVDQNIDTEEVTDMDEEISKQLEDIPEDAVPEKPNQDVKEADEDPATGDV